MLGSLFDFDGMERCYSVDWIFSFSVLWGNSFTAVDFWRLPVGTRHPKSICDVDSSGRIRWLFIACIFLNLFYFPQKCEKIDCSINANFQNPQKTWNSNFAFEKHVVGNQCTCWLIFRFNFWCFSQKIHKIQFLHGNESVPMQTNGFLSLLQNHRIYYKRRSSFIGAVPIC